MAAFRAVAVDGAAGLHGVDLKVAVELTDEGRIRVGKHQARFASGGFGKNGVEFALFALAKIFLGVGSEAGGGGDWIIRRVNVGKVTAPSLVEGLAEILHGQMHAFERAARGQNIFLVVKAGIFVGANRHIEFVAGVDAPEAVEAGLVEKNHAGGAFHDFLVVASQVVLGADEVKIIVAFGFEFSGVFVQPPHEFIGKIADGKIGVNEFGVDVAQEGAHPGKAVFEMEENCATTYERLEVAGDFSGEKFVELREELRLAADPFQKWLRRDRRGGGHRAEGKLFVADFCEAGRFGNLRAENFSQRISRGGNFPADFITCGFWIRSLIWPLDNVGLR